MSTGEPLLVVSDLYAGYGSLQAVAGISLQVNAAETVALIGRNGAGKTTSLLAIAGLRYGRFPGSVTLGGAEVSRATSRQIVDTRRRSGRKAVATTMERVFDLFPILRTYATRNAGFLSGGEQQMVAIGQALMAEPKVLMLDEPTSGLAPIVIRTIYDAIGQLRDQGLAILVVEQSVPRALANSSRCYVMERGRIVISGESAVLAQDEHVFAIVRGTEEVPSPARTS
jgi:branched-chain amino acid transport system ATP-binding protein